MIESKTLTTKPSADYELLDSGNEEKLERWGRYILRRPDPQALWNTNLPEGEWKKADLTFDAERKIWKKKNVGMQNEWQVAFGELKFNVKPTAFKHTGVFPEQEPNWQWIAEKIKNAGRPVKILNLFGYTGGATLAALSAGADVTHVDGSKAAVNWAKENAAISGLDKKTVRWLVDDARKFVMREIKRGGKYDCIVMDPPAFGRGGKGEIWKIEKDLLKLLEDCSQILSENPLFFIVNGYASGYSPIAYYQSLEPILKTYGGSFEYGELTIEESKMKRFLPAGIFVRWSK
jgi:23S rRNA (cytosine1962-C5)-methyltransferase